MKLQIIPVIFSFMLIVNCCKAQEISRCSCSKEKGLQLAETIIKKQYGYKQYNSCKPYAIRLLNDSTFVVKGTLHSQKGGTAVVYINRNSCTALKVIHEK